jgi:hypothetical protein
LSWNQSGGTTAKTVGFAFWMWFTLIHHPEKYSLVPIAIFGME